MAGVVRRSGHVDAALVRFAKSGYTHSVRPRESGDPGAMSAFTRVFNALCTLIFPRLGPRFRGGERSVLLRP
jgi:hypothetical protein